MASSFGAVLAAAAKQSRLAKEEERKNQLAMMQAGFAPKAQPEAAPSESMLGRVLPSWKDQFAYRSQMQPGDYEMTKGHPAIMAQEQRTWEGRLDDPRIAALEAQTEGTLAATEGLKLENERKRAYKSLWDRIAALEVESLEVDLTRGKAQVLGIEAETAATKQATSIESTMRPLRHMIATLEHNTLKEELETSRELRPLQKELAELRIDATRLDLLKNGSGFITSADGSRYMTRMDPTTGSYTITRLFGPDPGDAHKQSMSELIMLSNMYTLTTDTKEKKSIHDQILAKMALIGLGNLLSKSPEEIELDPSGKIVAPEEEEDDEFPPHLGVTPAEKAFVRTRKQVQPLIKSGELSQKDYDIWKKGRPAAVEEGEEEATEWDEINKMIKDFVEARKATKKVKKVRKKAAASSYQRPGHGQAD